MRREPTAHSANQRKLALRGRRVRAESRVRLNRVLRKPKDRLTYEYDVGDGWEHVVVLETLLPFDPGRHRAPVVTDGRRACPPEDDGARRNRHQPLLPLDGSGTWEPKPPAEER